MGDVPPASGSEDFLNQESQQPSFVSRQNQHAFASQLDMTSPPSYGNGRQNAFNMAAVANNLPQVGHGGYRPTGGYPAYTQQQRFTPHASSPPMMQHSGNPYAAQHNLPTTNQHYYLAQQGQQYYGAPLSPTQPQVRSGMGYYPNQMMMGSQQPNHHMPPGYYYQPSAPGQGYHQGMPQPMMAGQYYGHNMVMGDFKGPQSPTVDEVGSQYTQASQVRGPPRKPRQSVHHACKEAPGLESLFLISKSNCAFANFKDEATCIAAQQGLHDSKFQSVRLVSRLRKSTVEGATGVTAPTGPAASVEGSAPQETPVEDKEPAADKEETTETTHNDVQATSDGDGTAQKDKFFILKSLTVEDLELSVRTGIWATQSHNEEVLNNAFQAADNVYLVFSANKSGEYYGYARMVSSINEDPEAAIQFAPKVQTANDMDLPKAIPTEATEFAPKGRIIDDSARGTIFWEAERDDTESEEEEESDASSGKPIDGEHGATKAWGKPFKLEWLSTTRLPFYRTRGLRNPWNSNREVKIARDGTELEPSVGRRLIGLFNRVQSPVPGSIPIAMRPAMMMPGYGMRPYHG
ncbi:YT521-B-like domain-containing protein [Plectosphaerella cucumerina]|uniref:YT521-B-like domain-containing protein n=1 Tax=Plectosphaerella cucumerina TaxID=40658 RepID=A0A8K0TKS4_9PEZI|nr:YT521-B-like domain-containing protein [Plectosphaerella cucumerina]